MRPLFISIGLLSSLSFATPALADTYSSSVDGEYYLQSPLDFALELKFTRGAFKNYSYGGSVGSSEIASGGNLAFEWLPMCNYGKLGVGVSLGMNLLPNVVVGRSSGGQEIYSSLTALPLGLFLSYRFDYFINQPVVPFVKVGPSYTWTKETSSTGGARSGTHGANGLDYTLGAQLSFSALDRSMQRHLDATYGFNQTYLVFEYVNSRSIDGIKFPDISRDEYRLGLRAEF